MPESTAKMPAEPGFVAFAADACLAAGDLRTVAKAAKKALDGGCREPVLVFDAITSRPVEVDFRGSLADVEGRISPLLADDVSTASALLVPRGPGRPKLGVVAREVTLLPRHWDWLNRRPGRRLGHPA